MRGKLGGLCVLGWGLLVVTGILPAGAQTTDPRAPRTDTGAVQRGAYIAGAANCANCHTTQGGQAFAGGPAVSTPFGVFFPPNITPDRTHGIGQWSFDNFKRALRRGVSPNNTHYYPVFPYASYTGMSDADIADLWTYLRTVPPVAQINRPHEVGSPFSWRLLLAPWKVLFLDRGPIKPDSGKSPEWNRGRYLVEAVTHCAECHTPRNLFAALERSRYMAGVRNGVEGWDVPNISPDPETGIGRWSVEEIAGLLAGRGMRAMHVGGPMRDVVKNTSKLTDADRLSMATSLKSLPARYGEAKSGAGMCMGMMCGGSRSGERKRGMCN
jgi:mono/diheme cytochrome c family protein